MDVRIKRVYEAPSPDDGFRVLVDRIWPRGVSKEKADVDLWAKDLGPSTELRKWFNHESAKWEGFQRRYLLELTDKRSDLRSLKQRAGKRPLTIVYSARNETQNQAVVLRDLMMSDHYCPEHGF